jgi:hypothetical protein
VKRSLTTYASFLLTAVALFGTAAALTEPGGMPWSLQLARFVLLGLGIVTAVATWYTGVLIASRHKVAWPLLLTMGLVVVAGAIFAVACYRAPLPRL